MKRYLYSLSAMTVIVLMVSCILAGAGDKPLSTPKLPSVINVASYAPTSSTGMVTVALCDAIRRVTGMKVNLLAMEGEFLRSKSIRTGECEFAYFGGVHLWSAVYGTGTFDVPDWGPQPVRLLFKGSILEYGPVTTAASGIRNIADVKGKKVAHCPSNLSALYVIQAAMAGADITWDDVIKVPASDYSGNVRSIIEGRADVAVAVYNTPLCHEAAAGPSGFAIVNLPNASDTKYWRKAQSILPIYNPVRVTKAPNLKPGTNGGGYPEVFGSTPELADHIAYAITKGIVEGYDYFKDAGGRAPNYTLENAIKDLPPVPFHTGTIQYFKDKGIWNAYLSKHQEKSLALQKELRSAWEAKRKK